MTVSKAFKLFFLRAFDFHGCSSRREFWLGVLPNAIIMLLLIVLLIAGLVAYEAAVNPFSVIMIVVFSLFCLVELLPSVSLIFRRMHDIGKSGKYILVLFIPVIGYIWYIYLVTRPSGFYKPMEEWED